MATKITNLEPSLCETEIILRYIITENLYKGLHPPSNLNLLYHCVKSSLRMK